MNILIEETKKVREITKNKYFKFNEEDGVVTFNKREYLLVVTLLLKQSDIDIKIYQLLEKHRFLRNNDE